MTTDQITHHLNRWQKVMQAMDARMSALFALTGDTDGPLPRAIGELQENYTRLLTEHLGWDSDALQDWWLDHEFGAIPMQAGFKGEGMREIRDNADLAWFIHEDKARSSMTEYGKHPDVTRLVEALTELCDEIDKHEIHAVISKTSISWFKRKARSVLAAHHIKDNGNG